MYSQTQAAASTAQAAAAAAIQAVHSAQVKLYKF